MIVGLSMQQAKAIGLGHLHPGVARARSAERELIDRFYAGDNPPSQAPDDGLNKLERDFKDRALEPALVRGDLAGYAREPVRFRIGGGCYFVPDYVVSERPGEHGVVPRITVVEVKGGFFRDDAKVKIKVAADKYPFLGLRWLIVFRLGSCGRGDWDVHEVDRRGIHRDPIRIHWIHGG